MHWVPIVHGCTTWSTIAVLLICTTTQISAFGSTYLQIPVAECVVGLLYSWISKLNGTVPQVADISYFRHWTSSHFSHVYRSMGDVPVSWEWSVLNGLVIDVFSWLLLSLWLAKFPYANKYFEIAHTKTLMTLHLPISHCSSDCLLLRFYDVGQCCFFMILRWYKIFRLTET